MGRSHGKHTVLAGCLPGINWDRGVLHQRRCWGKDEEEATSQFQIRLEVGKQQTIGAPPPPPAKKKPRKPKGFYKANTVRVTIRTKHRPSHQKKTDTQMVRRKESGRAKTLDEGGEKIQTSLNILCLVDLTSELCTYLTYL